MHLLIEFWKDEREDRYLDEFHWITEDLPRCFASRNAMRYTKQRGSPLWTTGTTSVLPRGGVKIGRP